MARPRTKKMYEHCHKISSCKLCRFGSKYIGHVVANLLGKKWSRLERCDVDPLLAGLDLQIVGGLYYRGYTEHDIDVVGSLKDVSVLARRLADNNISNLLYYCGTGSQKHSHFTALMFGLRGLFFGNNIYK